MCSQFNIKMPATQLINLTRSLFDEVSNNLAWEERIYPFSNAPVIAHDHNNCLQIMKYSLVPSWSKTAKPKFATYNARLDRLNKDNAQLELIYNAPTWRTPFKSKHCIVPLTSFIESCRVGTHAGNMVKFNANATELLFSAGIWDTWINNETNEVINSFAILTDEPCAFIQKVGHDRQPVFLTQENANLWLENNFNSVDLAYSFLKHNQQTIDYSVENIRQLKGFEHDLFS